MTNPESRIGTASTASGNTSATTATVLRIPSTATHASSRPRRLDPESPMKIDAGWKLCRRKPIAAPAVAAARSPAAKRSASPSAEAVAAASDRAMTANVAAAIVHTPAASPSTPSVKFTTFMTATMPTTVSTAPAPPSSSTPISGIEISSTLTPEATGITAAPTCPSSLTPAFRSTASSTAPISAIAAAPSRMPRTSVLPGTNNAARDEHAGQDGQAAQVRHRAVVEASLARGVDRADPLGEPGGERRGEECDHRRDEERPQGVELVHRPISVTGASARFAYAGSRQPPTRSPASRAAGGLR